MVVVVVEAVEGGGWGCCGLEVVLACGCGRKSRLQVEKKGLRNKGSGKGRGRGRRKGKRGPEAASYVVGSQGRWMAANMKRNVEGALVLERARERRGTRGTRGTWGLGEPCKYHVQYMRQR